MAAIVGAAGLRATLAAVRRGAIVAFANKECLVCAGELMMTEIARRGARLLPVDSEHNAIRSEEHTSELQSLMRISYAVFCLKKKNQIKITHYNTEYTHK